MLSQVKAVYWTKPFRQKFPVMGSGRSKIFLDRLRISLEEEDLNDTRPVRILNVNYVLWEQEP